MEQVIPASSYIRGEYHIYTTCCEWAPPASIAAISPPSLGSRTCTRDVHACCVQDLECGVGHAHLQLRCSPARTTRKIQEEAEES